MKMATSKVDTNFTNNTLRERTFSEKQASKTNSSNQRVRSLHAISDHNLSENVDHVGDIHHINNVEEPNIYSSAITDSEYEDDEEEDHDGSRKRYIALGVVCLIAILALIGVGTNLSGAEEKEKESPIAKVRKKCKEYTDLACSFQSSDYKDPSQIVLGKKVPRGFLPHQAFFKFSLKGEDENFKAMCGGSLINEKFILTAAHCVDNVVLTSGEVLLGSLNKNDSNSTLWKKNKKVYVHPNYNRSTVIPIADIALIELEEDVKFNSDVRPICLNTKLQKHYDPIITSGWGLTESKFSFVIQRECENESSEYLKMAEVLIYDEAFKYCRSVHEGMKTKYSDKFIEIIDETFICGAHFIEGVNKGDSGGPLQVKLNSTCQNTWEQIGVNSQITVKRGKLPYDGKTRTIQHYVKVEYFIPWITSLAWSD